MDQHDAYQLYRGKCLQYATAAVDTDPTLTLVRGHCSFPRGGGSVTICHLMA
jgi:hypothetical protein